MVDLAFGTEDKRSRRAQWNGESLVLCSVSVKEGFCASLSSELC